MVAGRSDLTLECSFYVPKYRSGGGSNATALVRFHFEQCEMPDDPMPLEKPVRTLRNGVARGDPMNAPRCRAHSKRTGLPCRQPAVRGRPVCRMHGARAGGPKGERNGMWRHGCCENEVRDAKREARAVHHLWRAIVAERWSIIARHKARESAEADVRIDAPADLVAVAEPLEAVRSAAAESRRGTDPVLRLRLIDRLPAPHRPPYYRAQQGRTACTPTGPPPTSPPPCVAARSAQRICSKPTWSACAGSIRA